MSALLRVRIIITGVAVILGIVGVSVASAGVTEIYDCNQGVVRGRAVLMQDLDCTSVFPQSGVTIDRGTLDLSGHTLVTSGTRAVECHGNCTIFGPGTITGDGNGIVARKTVRVRNVDFSVTIGAIGAVNDQGTAKVVAEDVTISGSIFGVYANEAAKVRNSTITTTGGIGVVTGWPEAHVGGPCPKGALQLRGSSVTGSGTGPCPIEGANCADVISCDARPRIFDSTCETSCQGDTGIPCASWGVCSAD